MRLALGVQLGPRISGTSYTAEATALFARMTSQPDTTRKGHINTLIAALKTGNVWAKLDALYLFAAHDSQAGLLNWVSTSHNATLVNAPSFVADRGFTGNGTSSYISSGTNASALTKFLQDSAHMSGWNRTETNAVVPIAGYIDATGSTFIYPRQAGNLSGRINDVTTLSVATATAIGLSAVNRSGATAKEIYRNGASVTTSATASAGAPAGMLGFLTAALSFAPLQVSMGSIGGSLSAGEQLALYNAVAAYMTAVGA